MYDELALASATVKRWLPLSSIGALLALMLVCHVRLFVLERARANDRRRLQALADTVEEQAKTLLLQAKCAKAQAIAFAYLAHLHVPQASLVMTNFPDGTMGLILEMPGEEKAPDL